MAPANKKGEKMTSLDQARDVRQGESLDIDTVLQNAVSEIYEALGLEEVAIQLAAEDE